MATSLCQKCTFVAGKMRAESRQRAIFGTDRGRPREVALRPRRARPYSTGRSTRRTCMDATTTGVVLTVGPTFADPAFRGVLELHGYTLEERAPHNLPEAMTGYAALILNGQDGATD